MKKFVIATAAAGMLFGGATVAQAEKPDTTRVWICHFDDHEAAESWNAAGTTLHGDYVLGYRSEMPGTDQVDYCESRGGELIEVPAVAAERGHDAQLLERVGDYSSSS